MSEPSTETPPSQLELVQEHSLTLKLELERMIFDGSFRVGERLNESTLAARLGPGAGLCARGFRRWENRCSSPLHAGE